MQNKGHEAGPGKSYLWKSNNDVIQINTINPNIYINYKSTCNAILIITSLRESDDPNDQSNIVHNIAESLTRCPLSKTTT